MTRTNIEIDDDLVAEVSRKYALSSKREAVDLALRKAAGSAITLTSRGASRASAGRATSMSCRGRRPGRRTRDSGGERAVRHLCVDRVPAGDRVERLPLRRVTPGGRTLTIATTEVVGMELLAGTTDELALAKVTQLVDNLTLVRVIPALDFPVAAALHHAARQSGRTVRKLNDCLIAAVAIRTGTPIVHRDADFEVIASISDFRTRSYIEP